MNNTMTDLNDSVGSLRNKDELIQQMLDRISALEKRPDETKQMLAEYARNWDSLNSVLDGLRTNQTNVNGKLVNLMQDVLKTVHDKRIVIDNQVLREIEGFIQATTGFNLRSYIAKVQADAINSQFEALRTSVKQNTDNVSKEVKKLTEAQNERIRATDKTGEHIQRLASNMKLLWTAFFVLALVQVFTISLINVNSLIKHPFMAVFSLVIVAVIGIIIFLINKKNRDSDSNGY